MTMTKGRIDRAGKICFHDAELSIWEDGISEARARSGWAGEKAWERQFKREVFARIVQTLNRLGWTCVIPQDKIDSYGIKFARNRRYCTKGDLKADLSVSGRHIEFKMFQSVNTPTRPDHEGRYEWDKEACMPYLLRLEMERTRRRIRDYLCNVFTGYEFEPTKAERKTGATAMEIIEQRYRESGHFKGDLIKYTISGHNNRSCDGGIIEHGARVWFTDYHGRILAGTAYYNINNMWWVVTGTHGLNNKASFEIYTRRPENLRIKRNASLRRKRLERELAKATEAMKFERAAVLRDILFPGDPQLFVVWHKEHKAYHCAGFSGYTADKIKAGRFTADEVRAWRHEPNEVIALAGEREAA